MKKSLSLLLSLIMLLGLLPISAFAADDPYAGYDTVTVTSQDKLEAAITAVQAGTPTVITIGGDIDTYSFPTSNIKDKTIVFKANGDKTFDATFLNVNGSGNLVGADLTFDGVNVTFRADSYYMNGYVGLNLTGGKLTYKNCTVTGAQYLYTDEAVFANVTFENTADYCVRTYAAPIVTFTDCIFNTGGKAVLVYNDYPFEAELTFDGCTFNSDGTLATDKAAVEVGDDPSYSSQYTLTFENNCTANGFVANNSTSPLWGNKNNMSVEDLGVEVVIPTYTITWANEDGTPIKQVGIIAGATPIYTGETPTKPADDLYTYEFAGWTPKVGPATEDVTYTAVFEAIEKPKPALPFIVTGVTQIKTIDAETEAALEGAVFELYRISATGSRKLHGTYTSNATGRITARTLSSRFTYELVMIEAPEGYDLLETPIIFRVQYNRPLQQVVPVTKTVVETPEA